MARALRRKNCGRFSPNHSSSGSFPTPLCSSMLFPAPLSASLGKAPCASNFPIGAGEVLRRSASLQAMQIGVARIELDRLGNISERAVMRACLLVGAGALVIGGDHFRIEPDRRGEIGDGARKIALVLFGQAAAEKSGSEFCIELDRGIEVLDGKVVFALHPVGLAAT